MFDVITVGSATVDAYAKTDKTNLIRIKTPDIDEEMVAYPSGEKLLVKQLEFTVGGGGTNTAVSFARMGLITRYLGKVGGGGNAERVLKCLKAEGIGTELIQHGERTGFSIVLDAHGTDRTILAYKGSNNSLSWNKINKKKLKTKWFYISSMMEESFKTAEKVAEYAHKNNMQVMFNPSSYLVRKGKDFLKKILSNTDILVLNRKEADILMQDGIKSMDQIMAEIRMLGPKNVIVTDGKKGAYALFGDSHYEIHPKPVKIHETTGAGDAFGSGFLAAYIKTDGDVEKSLKVGTANAQSVVKNYGAKNILLTWRQALKQIKVDNLIVKKKLLY